MGFVTTIKGVKDTKKEEDVATFNIYGVAARDPKNTFGDVDKSVFSSNFPTLLLSPVEDLFVGESP